jgi:hypothetical protein
MTTCLTAVWSGSGVLEAVKRPTAGEHEDLELMRS